MQPDILVGQKHPKAPKTSSASMTTCDIQAAVRRNQRDGMGVGGGGAGPKV